jgi:hypothetical protein
MRKNYVFQNVREPLLKMKKEIVNNVILLVAHVFQQNQQDAVHVQEGI